MSPVSSILHTPAAPRLADYIIKAKAIYSMAENHTVYRAIALRDEWIVAVSEDPNGLDGLAQPYADAPNFSGQVFWNVSDLVEVANFAVR